MPDQLDICVNGKNAVYLVTFFLGDIIGRYKRNSLVKIMKEKFGNLKT